MLTDQSDSRGKKRAGSLPGIPVSIKGADLHLHLISDLFLGAKGSVFKGSLSLLQLVMATVSPLFLAFSFLSFKHSFLFYRLAAVGSSSLYQQETLWPPPFLHGPHSSVSLLSKRSWWVLTDLFLQWLLHMLWSAIPHSLFSLYPSLYYFHSFFFPIQVNSLSPHSLPPGQANSVAYLTLVTSLLWFMLPCGLRFSRHFTEATPTQ